LLIVIVLFVLLVPVGWTALAAFGLVPDTTARPPAWPTPTLANFDEIGLAEPDFWAELLTSSLVAVGATALALAVAVPAAYATARSGRVVHRRVGPALLTLASVPAIAYVASLDQLWRAARLGDTALGVVIAEAAGTAPLAAFVLIGAIGVGTRELEQAAELDGAEITTRLRRIVLPATWSSIAAVAIVLFAIDWNSLLIPLVLTAGHVPIVTVALSDFFTFERELEWPTAAAALVVSLLPLMLLVAVLHRVLTRFRLPDADVF
jgi:multiple sugar transport system permease protein